MGNSGKITIPLLSRPLPGCVLNRISRRIRRWRRGPPRGPKKAKTVEGSSDPIWEASTRSSHPRWAL
eukprot:2241157-Pyramimonas_sp.AAC.1